MFVVPAEEDVVGAEPNVGRRLGSGLDVNGDGSIPRSTDGFFDLPSKASGTSSGDGGKALFEESVERLVEGETASLDSLKGDGAGEMRYSPRSLKCGVRLRASIALSVASHREKSDDGKPRMKSFGGVCSGVGICEFMLWVFVDALRFSVV